MFETPKKIDPEKDSTTDVSRRQFLAGVGAALVTTGLPTDTHAEAPARSLVPPRRPHRVEGEGEVTLEVFLRQYSGTVTERIIEHSSAFLPQIQTFLARAERLTQTTTPETALQQLREGFGTQSLPFVITDELTHYLPFQMMIESSLEGQRVSPVGARGLLQLMPATVQELGQGRRDVESIDFQVKTAERLYHQIWQHLRHRCRDELDWLRSQYGMSEDDFMQTFVVPTLWSGYHAGMGTISRVVQGYVADLQSHQRSLQLLLERPPIAYDQYQTMAEYTYHTGRIRGFGSRSVDYAAKLLGVELAFRTEYPSTYSLVSTF